MSFGLLTAISIRDVPKLMDRLSHNYRNGVYKQDRELWIFAADLLEGMARQLDTAIKVSKPPRERMVKSADKPQRERMEKEPKRERMERPARRERMGS